MIEEGEGIKTHGILKAYSIKYLKFLCDSAQIFVFMVPLSVWYLVVNKVAFL